MWTSSNSGDPLPVTGCQDSVVFATNGLRTLTLTGSESVGLNVVEPPPNLPPAVELTSPAYHAQLPIDQPITRRATAVDPEGASPLSCERTVQLGSHDPVVVSSEATVQWTPTDAISFQTQGTYTVKISLNVTDPDNNVGTGFVTLEWVLIFF